MQQGVTRKQLRRSCGLSSSQLDQWQQDDGDLATQADLATPDARVFSVLGDMPTGDAEPADSNPGQQLELRLGGWVICVRQADSQEPGSPACCR
jgi:hypothetical protein